MTVVVVVVVVVVGDGGDVGVVGGGATQLWAIWPAIVAICENWPKKALYQYVVALTYLQYAKNEDSCKDFHICNLFIWNTNM